MLADRFTVTDARWFGKREQWERKYAHEARPS